MLDKSLNDVPMQAVADALMARWPRYAVVTGTPRSQVKLYSRAWWLRCRKKAWMCSTHESADYGYPVETVQDVLDYMDRFAKQMQEALVPVTGDVEAAAEERERLRASRDRREKKWFDDVKPIQITIDNGVHVMDVEIVYVDDGHPQSGRREGFAACYPGWGWRVVQSRKCSEASMQLNTSDTLWSRNAGAGEAMAAAWSTLTDGYQTGTVTPDNEKEKP